MIESTLQETSWCAALFESKAAQLLIYGRALGLSHSEAEDVLQEVFVGLMRLSGRPDQPEHYCVRAFRNRAVNLRRGFWRRVARELESARWFEPDPREHPSERAAMKCLAELPSDQREVIVLKLWHDHTFEEIGALTGVSPNTAAGRYRYGLKKIRTCLKGMTDEEFERSGSALDLMDPAPTLGQTS